MARQRRMEYAGAMYHVMARGDRREDIFYTDGDRQSFLETLGEACAQTGWKVHAWVLMSNHYHLVLETPEANLVAGMKWLQNTYTRRFNSKHQLWGHLFGGRYKAIVCEDDSQSRNPTGNQYFLNLVDYVHLNPVRAGLVPMDQGKGLLEYPWSSLRQSYGVAASKRVPWACVEKVLHLFGGSDHAVSRRKYLKHLERLVNGDAEAKAGIRLPENQSLNSTIQRGWYWGSQKFQEDLLKLLKKQQTPANRTYRSSSMEKQHGEARARALLKAYMKKAGYSDRMLKGLPGSHPVKVFIAREIKQATTVPLVWLAENLHMKSPANVSQQIRRMNRGEIKPPQLSRIVD